MGFGTILSRLTGFIRNLLLVAVLGTGILGDAYNVANTTPNILYNLLIGGALSAVFVPQIVKSFRDADGGSAYVSRLISLLTSALVIITAAAMLVAPLFITLYAPSFSGRSRCDDCFRALLPPANSLLRTFWRARPSRKCQGKIWANDVGSYRQ